MNRPPLLIDEFLKNAKKKIFVYQNHCNPFVATSSSRVILFSKKKKEDRYLPNKIVILSNVSCILHNNMCIDLVPSVFFYTKNLLLLLFQCIQLHSKLEKGHHSPEVSVRFGRILLSSPEPQGISCSNVGIQ